MTLFDPRARSVTSGNEEPEETKRALSIERYPSAQRTRTPLGHIRVDPDVTAFCLRWRLAECLEDHAHGRWGSISLLTTLDNARALVEGDAVVSVHSIDPTNPYSDEADRLWIATSHDRTVTRCGRSIDTWRRVSRRVGVTTSPAQVFGETTTTRSSSARAE